MANTKEVLCKLHVAVANDLLAKIETGEASAQELNAAIKFLKDNGIEAIPVEDSPLTNLAKSLPDFSQEEMH